MSARELFENIRSERRELQELNDRIEVIMSRAGVKTILPQPVIVHTNKTGSVLEDAVVEAAELTEELERRRKMLMQDIHTADQIISQIRCSEYRRVLTAYYLTGDRRVRMEDVAQKIPCAERSAWRYFRKGMKVAEEIYQSCHNMAE